MNILRHIELDRIALAKHKIDDEIETEDDKIICKLYDLLTQTIGEKEFILSDFKELYNCSSQPFTKEQEQRKFTAICKAENTLRQYNQL